ASYWVHNGLVHVEGQKMSKSLGNSVYAAELLSLARPVVIRYYLASAHYRSTIDYHGGSLREAGAAFARIEGFLARATELGLPDTGVPGLVPEAFASAMDDDLSVPQALAVLHETVRAGNAALDGEDIERAADLRGNVLAMTEVLGINPLSEQWRADADDEAAEALSSLVAQLIERREQAREARDFAQADGIRDALTASGITLEDGPDGSHWGLA